ncbi:hypothetical protein ADU59_06135 [Pararhizobium polonicum]|uniref:SpoVT-AbrB domain-containing protein n=1 Tax=Pararhizobium polonicum TaxID=1612624 RepID=A0A1C7P3Y5_9HYPH|nr:hypothetical protein [Pararhizobium polonicum]OBZ95968.1 hypothetical protein ADU59_06135 [Pararhizobium polonicum]
MNMLHLSIRPGSEKARIWQICDELVSRNGLLPSGRDVVDIYVAEGGHSGTGFTQYSHWKKAFLSQKRQEDDAGGIDPAMEEPSLGSVAFRSITISAEGHLVLPKDMRRAMLLDGDGRATISVVDGELRIVSPRGALHRLQRRTRGLATPGSLVSEELITERRAEADAE